MEPILDRKLFVYSRKVRYDFAHAFAALTLSTVVVVSLFTYVYSDGHPLLAVREGAAALTAAGSHLYSRANLALAEVSVPDSTLPKIDASALVGSASEGAASFLRSVASWLDPIAPAQTVDYVRGSATPANTARGISAQQPNRPATTTVIYQTIRQPVVERIIERSLPPVLTGMTDEAITARLQQLDNRWSSQLAALSASIPSPREFVSQPVFSQSQRIDTLSNADISNADVTSSTWTGGTIRDATITGGSVTATAFSGTLGIGSGGTGTSTAPSYGQLLLGQSDGSYNLIATSSLGLTASAGGATGQIQYNDSGALAGSANFTFSTSSNTLSVIQASTTRFSIFDKAYFGASATTTIDSTGAITVTSNSASTFPFASSTAITASGTAYFAVATTTSFFGAGLSLCQSGNVLTYDGAGKFGCAADQTGGGGGGAWPFAPSSYAGTANQSTTTPLWLNGTQLIASSTLAVNATTTNLHITSLASALLATDQNGRVVATTSIGTNLLTGSLGTINGTSLAAAGSITITAASSTALSDVNSWTGLNQFANASTTLLSGTTAWFTTFIGSLTGNASTATALQTARTINGTSFDGTSNITITAASSTALSDINTFSARQNFANATSTLLSVGTLWQTSSATSTFVGGLDFTRFNLTATSTGSQGINLTGGCFAVNGTCLPNVADGTASSTLLADINSWTGKQTFANATSTLGTITTGWATNWAATYASSTALTVSGDAFFPGSGIWNSSGNVGIGTTTPGTFSAGGDTGAILNLYNNNANTRLFIQNGTSAGGGAQFIMGKDSATTNSKYFDFVSSISGSEGQFSGRTLTDAMAAGSTWLQVNRSGTSITSVSFPNGNVGIGTTTPWRLLSMTGAVSTAQMAISYDSSAYTDVLTSSVGDYFVYPSGNDALFNNSNLWVCTGGSGNTNGCPSGTPSGQGNLIVETALGIASSTPFTALSLGASSTIMTTEGTQADSATITVDWKEGNQQRFTLAGNRTIAWSNANAPGETLRLIVCQDGTGSRTLTWPATVLWSGGSAPTLTTTANKCDILTFLTTAATGTVKQFGSSVLNF